MKTGEEPFEDCEFPSQFPQQDVAEHEVLMSFTDDDDAISFREWWNSEGSVYFNEWLEDHQQ